VERFKKEELRELRELRDLIQKKKLLKTTKK
jgi:hypothetical protein